MKLYTYRKDSSGPAVVGVGNSDGTAVLEIARIGLPFSSMNELIEKARPEEWGMLKEASHRPSPDFIPLEQVTLCAPIPRPRQDVICLGINYASHAEEAARFKSDAFGGERPYPIYFSKRVNEAPGDGGIIPAHETLVDSLDYESELAVIIGKDARDVPEEDVLSYILGYTILNDISARNVQTRHKQWYFGKSMDGFTPMGPCIATTEEFSWPMEVQVRSYVNGELRQNGNTNQLLFDIPHIIHELSQGMTLQAGTIIATGTPAGVGMGMNPPQFLHKGDVVVCEIDGIGRITNTIG